MTENESGLGDDKHTPAFSVIVLLIDDQPIIAEAVRRILVNHPDITFHYCQDPTKAIETASALRPTVILQDLVMPEIDGLLLLKYFRANSTTKDVPMIVLSTKEDAAVKAEAFALGANDYLVKLPDQIELIARIRYHSASYTRLLERNDAYEKLAKSQQALQSELNEAAAYVRSTLPAPLSGPISTRWIYEPSTILGGDAFGYHWLDDDHFVFYLLDVCGHGVGAALLAISVSNFLRYQTLLNANFSEPASVLAALNETFQMENHNNMFFTIWYGVYQPSTREITYSNGGHPPPILIGGDSESNTKTHLLKLPGMVVGGMPNLSFGQAKMKVPTYNRFYLFSDGVYEIVKPDGLMMSYEEFQNHVEHLSGQHDVEVIVEYSRSLVHGQAFSDDFSILKVVFN